MNRAGATELKEIEMLSIVVSGVSKVLPAGTLMPPSCAESGRS